MDREEWMIILIGLALMFVAGSVTMVASRETCYAKWENSGMAVKWGLWSGCTVQRKDGTWIPDTSYREMMRD